MSFYGNVFYEFEQVFFKFKFQNSSEEKVDLLKDSSKEGTTATERWDILNFKSGNHWIGLQTLEEGSTEKGVTLFHAAPGIETQDLKTLDTEEEGTQLSAGQKIEVPTIKVDKAGHISSSEPVVYTLPQAADVVNEGMDDYEGEREILALEKSDAIEPDVELTPGDIVKISKLTLNGKGVVKAEDSMLVKLPMDKTDANFDLVNDRLDQAEQDIDELQAYNTTNDFASVKDKSDNNEKKISDLNNLLLTTEEALKAQIADGDTDLQEQVTAITNEYAKLSLTGNAPTGFDTFEDALGNLAASANAMGSAVGIQVDPSVAGQFQALVTYAGLMYWQLSIANSKIKELEDRIETLENK